MHFRHFLLALLLSCVSFADAAEAPKYWPLDIGSQHYPRLELALTAASRQKGLMNRKSMPEDAGMIFVFEEEEPLSFWMKNTLIPLDIVFVNAKGEVVAVHTMNAERPRGANEDEILYESRLPGYPSGEPAQFAIELNAGQLEQNGLKKGDKIEMRASQLLKLLRR